MKTFTEMTKEVDKSGFTPLLLACQAYSQWKVDFFLHNNRILQ